MSQGGIPARCFDCREYRYCRDGEDPRTGESRWFMWCAKDKSVEPVEMGPPPRDCPLRITSPATGTTEEKKTDEHQ